MKDIVLKIVGKQAFNGEGDDVEFVTVGRGCRKDNAIYLIYEESELSGMEGCTTSIKIMGDRAEMRRYGDAYASGTEVVFEPGKHFKGYYDTPYGPIEMEILTDALKSDFSEQLDRGTLDIGYQISLHGLAEGHNQLKLEILNAAE